MVMKLLMAEHLSVKLKVTQFIHHWSLVRPETLIKKPSQVMRSEKTMKESWVLVILLNQLSWPMEKKIKTCMDHS